MKSAAQIARELISIRSENPGCGERGMAAYLSAFLKDCGADVSTRAALPGRSCLCARLASGSAAPALVFICHMDTVPADCGWHTDPFEPVIKNDRLYGRGACDMKGGTACALSAFARAAAGPRTRDVVFIATVDEEADMAGAEAVAKSGWVRAEDWIIDTEPTDGKIRGSHKGRTWLDITAHGIAAHASTPENGADANLAAARMMTGLSAAVAALAPHPKIGKPTIVFGQIAGGEEPYAVPAHCAFTADLRLVPPYTTHDILNRAHALAREIEAAMPGITFDIETACDRPPVAFEHGSAVTDALRRAARAAGYPEPETGLFTGYTDTAVLAAALGADNACSFGPGSLAQAHKPDEYVALSEIERCEKTLTALVAAECLKAQHKDEDTPDE